jgi:hypothetical protein
MDSPCRPVTGNIALLLICVLVLGIYSFAQDLPTAKPETVGLSSERLERISTAVQKSIDDKRIAGAVTMVVRRGQELWCPNPPSRTERG